MDWLKERRSWDAKRWVQGLLYDKDADVRVRAAKFIAETDYLTFIKDLEAAYETEREKKEEIGKYLKELKDKLP